MKIRFVLGPAGSGKTHGCLGEIQSLLAASPEGSPLILLTPKQATFQWERQLLCGAALSGYARLQILSFERLAGFVLKALAHPVSTPLSDEGRLMVLRSLLTQKQDQLRLFRSSARLPGFARELLIIIDEFQRCRLSPLHLRRHAVRLGPHSRLGMKLEDVALLMDACRDWMLARNLGDSHSLLDAATEALASRRGPAPASQPPGSLSGTQFPSGFRTVESPQGLEMDALFHIESLWMDGFAELTPQELSFLAALAPFCGSVSIAFCLDDGASKDASWTSTWSLTSRCFRICRSQMAAIPGGQIETHILSRDPIRSRFSASPVLAHLEKSWSLDASECSRDKTSDSPALTGDVESRPVRLISCAKPESEVLFAASEILRHVRQGGRYRECAVLLRQFDLHHHLLRRIFNRYRIPFFLDRREAVSHHPLAELVRGLIRTVALGWAHEDWFGALKTGLMPVDDDALDTLENAAMASGWDRQFWRHPVPEADSKIDSEWLLMFHRKIVLPVLEFESELRDPASSPPAGISGRQLALALSRLWQKWEIRDRLKQWAEPRPLPDGVTTEGPEAAHATVWQQMNGWLQNLAMAFPDVSLELLDWLPIVESGLAGMTVGVIPPSLDQVLIGTVDRSRNPDLKMLLVLGMNESIFPAAPASGGILSAADRESLSREGVELGPDFRLQLGRENYLAYIACTRAREKLILTWSESSAEDRVLNASPYIAHIRSLLPAAHVERFAGVAATGAFLHPDDWLSPLIGYFGRRQAVSPEAAGCLAAFPRLRDAVTPLALYPAFGTFSPSTAERLHGPRLRVSVSALESFAACPFQFFVGTTLRGKDRDVLELDDFEKGSFMHETLARFHREARAMGKGWRDLSPGEAQTLASRVVAEEITAFRNGLFGKNRIGTLTAESLGRCVLDYIGTAVKWMSHYRFDPVAVELPFGMEKGVGEDKGEDGLPAWVLDLPGGHSLALRGKIDRIDVWISPDKDRALCVVMDYKSSKRLLDRALLQAGIQLQLPVYLNVLLHLKNPETTFGTPKLEPAGAFYINLRGEFAPGKNRDDVLSQIQESQLLAYRHRGRFNGAWIDLFDNRSGGGKSDQFAYSLNQDGSLAKRASDAMTAGDFFAFLDAAKQKITDLGQAVYAGCADVSPYRKGSATACDHCRFGAICRIDPWTHEYRSLSRQS